MLWGLALSREAETSCGVVEPVSLSVSSVTASDHASGSTSEEHQPRSTSTPGAGGEGDIEVGGNRKLAGSSK